MDHISLSDLQLDLEAHLIRVERDCTELVVTRQGRPDLVVIPLAELRSMRETLHLLGTTENARRLIESVREMNGEGDGASTAEG